MPRTGMNGIPFCQVYSCATPEFLGVTPESSHGLTGAIWSDGLLENDEIDVTIASGTSSVTNIVGSLGVGTSSPDRIFTINNGHCPIWTNVVVT